MGQALFNWYALYVKSRHEFAARDELRNKGIETYLPSIRKLRQWKDRKKYVDFPLFPGYLFVSILPNGEEFIRVLRTRGVVTIVAREPGEPSPVSPEEIETLQIMLGSSDRIDIYPHLKEGERVMIKRGALTGAEGILKRKEDQYLFFVNVELLGSSVGVHLYADEIETL